MFRDQDAFDRFILRFNHAEFFEAHEELEDLWNAGGRGNNSLRGLIQLCAALVHIQRGSPAGAVSVLHKSKDLLHPLRHRAPHLSLLLEKVARAAEEGHGLERIHMPLIDAALESELRRILGV